MAARSKSDEAFANRLAQHGEELAMPKRWKACGSS